MSIKGLMRDEISGDSNSLDNYKIPTKFGAIVDRYKQLKTQQWGGKDFDRDLDYMSKPVKGND